MNVSPRKRKRDGEGINQQSRVGGGRSSTTTTNTTRGGIADDWRQTLTIRPFPSSVFDKPRSVTPLAILRRAQLPLAFLDADAAVQGTSGRLFEVSSLRWANESSRDKPEAGAAVLIVRVDKLADTCFAVEVVEKGEARRLCALCKVGEWVGWSQLRDRAVVINEEAFGRKRGEVETHTDVKATERSPQHPPSPQQLTPDSTVLEAEAEPEPELPEPDLPELQTGVEIQQVTEPLVEIQSPQEVLDMVRVQYLEALYKSKGSLAYFAKGPLSRARASLFGNDTDLERARELLSFLENSILPFATIDKKYRDTLPDHISTAPVAGLSDGESDDNPTSKEAPAKKKKRRKGNSKPGKDGLWNDEESYILDWWRLEVRGDSDSSGVSSERRRAQRVAGLRMRETELQLILVLELMALRKHTRSNPQNEDTTSGKKRKNSPPDLDLTLDLIVDRLSIWQSLGSGDMGSLLADPEDKSTQDLPANQSSDHLRDFSTEVILPFFSARLPEKCASIHQKLGGHTSPDRPKIKRSNHSKTTSKPTRRPGEPTQRIDPRHQHARKKTLERALADERSARASPSLRNSIPPLLKRSETAPAAPPSTLKREPSDTPLSLSAIPPAMSYHVASQRTGVGVQSSKRFTQREVDLTAAARSNEARAKKKAAVAEDLKNAISTLKRPNRSEAVKELVDFSDTRRTHKDSQGQGVQVTATPKKGNSQDRWQATRPSTTPTKAVAASYVPSSGIRPGFTNSTKDPSSAESKPAVEGTPCKASLPPPPPPPAPVDSSRAGPMTPSQDPNSRPRHPTSSPIPLNLTKPSHKHTHESNDHENDEAFYRRMGWDDY